MKSIVLALAALAFSSAAVPAFAGDCADAAAKYLSNYWAFQEAFCNNGNPLTADQLKPVTGHPTSFKVYVQCEGDQEHYLVSATDATCANFNVR